MRRYVAIALLLAALVAAGCGSSSSSATPAADSGSSGSSSTSGTSYSASNPLKIGFIFIGANNDGGWNQAAWEGYQEVRRTFGTSVQTNYKINVPTGAQATQAAQSLVASGDKLIFLDSAGYENYTYPVAQQNPGVQFEQLLSSKTGPNYGSFNMAIEDAFYLEGMALAGAAKHGQIGDVSAFPFPNLQEIDGLALGIRAVNPNAKLHVSFIDSFSDPAKERQVTAAVISSGVDTLATTQNDAAPAQAASQAGLPWGGDALLNGASYGPSTYLTSAQYGWGPMFVTLTKDYMAHKPLPSLAWGTWKDGAVSLAPWGKAYYKLVPAAVRAKIAAVEKKLQAGTFEPYTGPILDQTGKIAVPAGKQLTPKEIDSLTFAVDNVIAKL